MEEEAWLLVAQEYVFYLTLRRTNGKVKIRSRAEKWTVFENKSS